MVIELCAQVNVTNSRSPNLARDRWSQISVKSLQKRTKADHQKKAINTVILMLMFFVFCYALEWFNIFRTEFIIFIIILLKVPQNGIRYL